MKYRITLTVSGYCRGQEVYEVEAESEEEAQTYWLYGKLISEDIIHDDRDHEVDKVEKIAP